MSTNLKQVPKERDAEAARVAGQRLARYVTDRGSLRLMPVDAAPDEAIEVPAGVASLLLDALGAMAAGRKVTLTLEDAELTTVEAADLLNVSRPHLIKLLEEERIPYRKVGTHRRVRAVDLLAFKERIDAEREAVLDALAEEAQAEGDGYPR